MKRMPLSRLEIERLRRAGDAFAGKKSLRRAELIIVTQGR